MNIALVEEIEIHRLNRCLADYNQFIKLPSKELSAIQHRYFSELHQLQHELDDLLNDLRLSILNSKKK